MNCLGSASTRVVLRSAAFRMSLKGCIFIITILSSPSAPSLRFHFSNMAGYFAPAGDGLREGEGGLCPATHRVGQAPEIQSSHAILRMRMRREEEESSQNRNDGWNEIREIKMGLLRSSVSQSSQSSSDRRRHSTLTSYGRNGGERVLTELTPFDRKFSSSK